MLIYRVENGPLTFGHIASGAQQCRLDGIAGHARALERAGCAASAQEPAHDAASGGAAPHAVRGVHRPWGQQHSAGCCRRVLLWTLAGAVPGTPRAGGRRWRLGPGAAADAGRHAAGRAARALRLRQQQMGGGVAGAQPAAWRHGRILS